MLFTQIPTYLHGSVLYSTLKEKFSEDFKVPGDIPLTEEINSLNDYILLFKTNLMSIM